MVVTICRGGILFPGVFLEINEQNQHNGWKQFKSYLVKKRDFAAPAQAGIVLFIEGRLRGYEPVFRPVYVGVFYGV